MKKLIGLFVIAMILSAGMATLSYAATDMTAPAPQTVKGDLLKVDGDFYIVKDIAGNEVRLHVDKSTRLEGTIKAGDKVEAEATERTMHCPLNTYRRRCRGYDTKAEFLAPRLCQSSRLTQSDLEGLASCGDQWG